MEDQKQEDLDIQYVFKSIKKGISGFLNSILWLINFSFKKILQLSVFVVIAVGICLGAYYMEKPYYRSELFISHIRLDNDYCYEMIRNLNSLINESRENADLAEKLQLKPELAKSIKQISYKSTNDKLAKQYTDSTSVLLPFKVEVEVYDNEVLPDLQKGILNYLESNEYAIQQKQIKKESLDLVELRIKDEIKEIDSLKRLVNLSIIPRGTGNGIILGEPIDPVSIYARAMISYEKLMDVNKDKLLNDSFHLMVGFNKNYKVAGHGKLFYIALGCLIGYIIGLLFLLRKNIKPIEIN
jgi:hypothetical protein